MGVKNGSSPPVIGTSNAMISTLHWRFSCLHVIESLLILLLSVEVGGCPVCVIHHSVPGADDRVWILKRAPEPWATMLHHTGNSHVIHESLNWTSITSGILTDVLRQRVFLNGSDSKRQKCRMLSIGRP